MLRRCRPALGTLVDIQLDGLPGPRLERALAAATAELSRCERILGAHRDDNDLARLRSAPAGAVLAIDPRTHVVLRQAARLARLSPAFDPRRDGAGNDNFADAFELLPGRGIRVLAPLDLDLGGIAKGYAIDRTLARLRQCGVPVACINAGGDLRTHGLATRLVLRGPRAGDQLFEFGTLRTGAAATSAQTYRRHLRAPRSGRPASSGHSYTVFAPTALLADALTKIVALSPDTAPGPLARHRAHAAIVDPDGNLRWLSGPPSPSVFAP